MAKPYNPALIAAVAPAVDELLTTLAGKRLGFAIIVFDFNDVGPGTKVDYCSNAERADMVAALTAWLNEQKGNS